MITRKKAQTSKEFITSSSSSVSSSENGDKVRRRRKSARVKSSDDDTSSSTSSIGPHTSIYNAPRCQARQIWMKPSSGGLVNLMGYAFRYGRTPCLVHLTKMLYAEPAICGFEAPLRGLIFSASYKPLDRRLLADLAACTLPLEPIIRTGALLESLLLMLQDDKVCIVHLL